MSDQRPPRLPPRLRVAPPPPPTPKPQPDQYAVYEALAKLDVRLSTVEARLAGLFKKSVVTIVAADFLVGLAKLVMEHWPK